MVQQKLQKERKNKFMHLDEADINSEVKKVFEDIYDLKISMEKRNWFQTKKKNRIIYEKTSKWFI